MISEKHIMKYCSGDISLVENYASAVNDPTCVWDCHHKAEILPCGRFTATDLKRFNLYWNRPPEELVFLKHSEHFSMHLQGNDFTKGVAPWNKGLTGRQTAWNKGIPCGEDAKRKTGETKTGRSLSDAHKKAISDSISGEKHPNWGKHLSELTKAKIAEAKARANVGKVWCNNGVDSKFVAVDQIPEGWKRGRLAKTMNWFNDGTKNIRAAECPAGYKQGRIKHI